MLAIGILVTFTGCESTADKAAKLEQETSDAFTKKGLEVARANREVEVLDTRLLTDANGAAVVVRLRSRASRPLVGVPISLSVQDSKGREVFSNDAPGLQPALVRVPVLRPGRETVWVNDQIPGLGLEKARVRVGQARPSARPLPRIDIRNVRFDSDPVSGIQAAGRVTNRSKVLQRRLTIFCVSQRRGRVVAAGRAVIDRLRPGASATFRAFFIGDPRRGKLSVSAPPSVL